ncbi:hypothetical protein MRX96_042516 [Rhipicephalus microplus]
MQALRRRSWPLRRQGVDEFVGRAAYSLFFFPRAGSRRGRAGGEVAELAEAPTLPAAAEPSPASPAGAPGTSPADAPAAEDRDEPMSWTDAVQGKKRRARRSPGPSKERLVVASRGGPGRPKDDLPVTIPAATESNEESTSSTATGSTDASSTECCQEFPAADPDRSGWNPTLQVPDSASVFDLKIPPPDLRPEIRPSRSSSEDIEALNPIVLDTTEPYQTTIMLSHADTRLPRNVSFEKAQIPSYAEATAIENLPRTSPPAVSSQHTMFAHDSSPEATGSTTSGSSAVVFMPNHELRPISFQEMAQTSSWLPRRASRCSSVHQRRWDKHQRFQRRWDRLRATARSEQWEIEAWCSRNVLRRHLARKSSAITSFIDPNTGSLVETQDEILEVAGQFYKNLYAEPPPTPYPFPFTKTYEEFGICDTPLIEEEVFAAFKSMNRNRSPGSDGLTVEFSVKFWKVLEGLLPHWQTGFSVRGTLSATQWEGADNSPVQG